MSRVLIYGAGQTGEQGYRQIRDSHEVVGFLDGNTDKKGQRIGNVNIIGGVDALSGDLEYDRIIIASFFLERYQAPFA